MELGGESRGVRREYEMRLQGENRAKGVHKRDKRK